METKKIKAGLEYATCDGQLVVPADPVRRGWYLEYSPKTVSRELVFAEQIDPWGSCLDAKRPTQTGLKCTMYEVDRDGNKIEDSATVCVIFPRDIKGSWKDFLVLHAERVRQRADEQSAEQAKKIFTELLSSISLPGTEASRVGVDYHYGWHSKTNKRINDKISRMFVVLDFDDVDSLLAMIKKLGSKLPAEVVTYLRENKLTADEFAEFTGKRKKSAGN